MTLAKTVTATTTAQTVTLDASADPVRWLAVTNHSASIVAWFTTAAGTAPATAVAAADNTLPALPGDTVIIDVGRTTDPRVSVIAASTTAVVTIAGTP